jgi:hypothetical protein
MGALSSQHPASLSEASRVLDFPKQQRHDNNLGRWVVSDDQIIAVLRISRDPDDVQWSSSLIHRSRLQRGQKQPHFAFQALQQIFVMNQGAPERVPVLNCFLNYFFLVLFAHSYLLLTPYPDEGGLRVGHELLLHHRWPARTLPLAIIVSMVFTEAVSFQPLIIRPLLPWL